MPRTFNREPHLVNLPSKNDVKNYFFNHNNWTGFNDDKNFVAIDQQSFSACKNVYVNEEGILRSRPYIKVKDREGGVNMTQVIDAWEFGPVNVYKSYITSNTIPPVTTYVLQFVNEDFDSSCQFGLVSNEVKLIVKDRKIFIFEPTTFNYYDMDTNTVSSANDFIYIPVNKVVTDGVEDDFESLNELTTSYIIRYLFKNFTDIDFTDILNKNVNIKIDGNEFEVVFTENTYMSIFVQKHDLPNNAYANEYIMGRYNKNTPLVDYVHALGQDICMLCTCDTTLGTEDNLYVPTNTWNIYWSIDYVTFTKLEFKDDIVAKPTLSKDGSMACILRSDGLYVISLISTDGSGILTYPTWTNIYSVSIPYYQPSLAIPTNVRYNMSCQNSISVVDKDTWIILYSLTPNTINDDYLFSTLFKCVYKKQGTVKYNNTVKYNAQISGINTEISVFSAGYYNAVPIHIKWLDNYTNVSIYSYFSMEYYDVDLNTLITSYSRPMIVIFNDTTTYFELYRTDVTTIIDYCNINYTDDFVVSDNCIYYSYSDYVDTSSYETVNKKKVYKYYSRTFNGITDTYEILLHTSTFTGNDENTLRYCRINTNSDENKLMFVLDNILYTFINNTLQSNEDLLLEQYDEDAFIRALFFENNRIICEYDGNLYTNNLLNANLTIDFKVDGIINYLYPSHYCELENYYLSVGNKLFISETKNSTDFKWYFPKINTENLEYDITNLHPISDKEVAIFQKNTIRYITYDNDLEAYRYYKARTDIGLIEGADVLTTFDGKYTIFNTQRGLVAMSYQEFIASTEQALTFITDSIYTHYMKYAISPIKLCKYGYWLFIYREDSNGGYMYDLRTNSWWPFEYTNNCSKFIVMDNLVYLISNNTIYSNLYDDITIYQDYIFNQEPVAIDWFIKSQKLHLSAINNYKNILSLTLNNTFNDDVDLDNDTRNKKKMRFTLKVKLFRTDISQDSYGSIVQKGYFSSGDTEKVISYDIDCISTFVQRVNFGKVIEFQYEIHSNNSWYEKIPLSLANISIKYKVGSQVR